MTTANLPDYPHHARTSAFAARLRVLRLARSWSYEECARRTGISGRAFAKWEKGETVPHADSLEVIAKLYRVSPNWLWFLNHQPSKGYPL